MRAYLEYTQIYGVQPMKKSLFYPSQRSPAQIDRALRNDPEEGLVGLDGKPEPRNSTKSTDHSRASYDYAIMTPC